MFFQFPKILLLSFLSKDTDNGVQSKQNQRTISYSYTYIKSGGAEFIRRLCLSYHEKFKTFVSNSTIANQAG